MHVQQFCTFLTSRPRVYYARARARALVVGMHAMGAPSRMRLGSANSGVTRPFLEHIIAVSQYTIAVSQPHLSRFLEPFLPAVSPRRFSPRRFPSRALRRVRRTVLVYCCRVGLRVGTYSLWNSLRYGASLHTVLASCVTSRRFSEPFLSQAFFERENRPAVGPRKRPSRHHISGIGV